MLEARPKSGNVKVADYEAEPFLRKLDPIVQRLQEDFPQARYDRRGLATLIAQLLQFMEDALGMNALPPKPFPKIPVKLFRDFSPNGALYVLATKAHEVTKARNLKKLDFPNPAKRKENLEILGQMRRELAKRGLLRPPRVYLHPRCSADAPRLQHIIKQLGGEVAQSEQMPGVSHVVYPYGPEGDPDDGVQYMRTLAHRGTEARVHWWYWPDSYDEFIPAEIAPEALDPDKQIRGPWRVYVRWVMDSGKFNEWMNPIDYETEEAVQEQERLGLVLPPPPANDAGETSKDAIVEDAPAATAAAVGTGQKRKANEEPEEGDLKRLRPAAAPAAPPAPTHHHAPAPQLHGHHSTREVEPGRGERVAPGVTRQVVAAPDRRALAGGVAPENISQGQQRMTGARAPPRIRHAPVPRAGTPPLARPIPRGASEPASPPQQLHRVPAHAAWYDYDTIAPLERQHVPEYFSGRAASKTPQAYKDIRNFLVNKYREDPTRVLTATEARVLLGGDASGVFRIWQFLDAWGLINFQAAGRAGGTDLEPRPGSIAPAERPLETTVASLPSAVSTDTLLRFPLPDAAAGLRAASTGGPDTLALATRRGPDGRAAALPSHKQVRFFCNAMPWVDCTACRYHCTKIPDVDLCPDAFADGRFPPGCTAKDFVRIDAPNPQATAPQEWSDQETLLLLEALELFKDNWAEVAEHVGTKSQVQCIMHFLQLPIEDHFLDELENPPMAGVAVMGGPGRRGVGVQAAAEANGAAFGGMQNGSAREGGDSVAALEPKPRNGASAAASASDPGPIPFADVGNPVMAQVAFLAAVVGPRVAAAAAQRALEVLAEEDPGDAPEAAAALSGAAPPPPGDAPVSALRMRAAAAAALAAAAVRARVAADAEERAAQRAVASAVEAALRRTRLKLRHLDAMDEALARERAALEAGRAQLVADRLQMARAKVEAAAAQQAQSAAQTAQLMAAARQVQQPYAAGPAPAASIVGQQGATAEPAAFQASQEGGHNDERQPAATAADGNPDGLQ